MKRSHGGAVLAFAFAAILILGRLGGLPLLNPDEGRNAEVAREMALSGDWLVPTYDGLPYLDKPAFYFATVALSFRALGTDEAAARLPSALFALALLGLVWAFARREYGRRTAALSVVVVASMPLYLAFARLVIFDMALAFFVTAAILAGYRAEEAKGPARLRWYLAGAAAAGMATLVKGPVGLILPALVLVAFGLVERRKRVLRGILHPWALLVFLALVLPWFVGVSLQRPDFPYYGLVKETLQRFTTPAFHRTAPFWYYGPVLLGVCFAWSLLLPEAAVAAWRRRGTWSRADRLLVTWSVTVVAFFSISQSKLPGYVLTATVALGVLAARLFDRAMARPDGRAARVVRHSAVALAVLGLVLAVWLAGEVFGHGFFSGLFGIHGRDYDRARAVFPSLLLTTALLSGAAVAGLLSRRTALVFAAFLVFPLSLVTVSFGGLERYAENASSRTLARQVEALSPAAGTDVATLEAWPVGLGYYLRRPVVLMTRDGSETTSNYIPFDLSRRPAWPRGVVPLTRRDQWLRARKSAVVLLARADRRPALDSLAVTLGGRVHPLVRGWSGLVLPAPTS